MNLTRRARRASALLVATAAAAVVLAGCGGAGWPTAAGASWQEAAPPTTTTAPSTPETTAPTSPAAGSGGGADPGTPSAPSRCTTAELAGSLGPADGAAGSVNQTLVLTNTGSRTCTLRGFPGVSYVRGDGGTQAGPSAVMVGARGGDVRLGPGGSAGAAMQLANVQNFDAASMASRLASMPCSTRPRKAPAAARTSISPRTATATRASSTSRHRRC